MTKFEIKTDSFEIRFTGTMPSQSAGDIFDAYMEQSVQVRRTFTGPSFRSGSIWANCSNTRRTEVPMRFER